MLTVIGPLRLRLQVMCGADRALGPGKAALLEAIRDQGSISAAGRKLEMSYRRCWLLVDEMNRCWSDPLVQARRGGSDQGAGLTPTGVTVLKAYRELEATMAKAAVEGAEYAQLLASLRKEPRESSDPRTRPQPDFAGAPGPDAP